MSPIFLKKKITNYDTETFKRKVILNFLELTLPLSVYSDLFSKDFYDNLMYAAILSKFLGKNEIDLEMLLDSILISSNNEKYPIIEKLKIKKIYSDNDIIEKLKKNTEKKESCFSEIKLSYDVLDMLNLISKDILFKHKICAISSEMFFIYCFIKNEKILNKIYKYNFSTILKEYNNFLHNIYDTNLKLNKIKSIKYYANILLKYIPYKKINKLSYKDILYFRYLLINKNFSNINFSLIKQDFMNYILNNLNLLRKYNFKVM